MSGLEQEIAAAAVEAGFALVGFAPLTPLPRAEFYQRWLGEGRVGEMGYLAREPERRLDPRHLDPRLHSVVSLGFPYPVPLAPGQSEGWRAALRGRIASYASGPDYHRRVLKAARAVGAAISRLVPSCVLRPYVDTGPVFEREWALAAGLGWFGKNTNLLHRTQGSYFFLAEIFTDLELGAAHEPYGEFCGTCRRCLDLCPTQALAEGLLLEPRLCISYLTIELRGPIPAELRPKLGNWIFGCDICQEVCPWNRPSAAAPDDFLNPYLPDLMLLDSEGFARRFTGTAVKRTKRRGLLRNVAVALGNSGNPEAVAPLAECLAVESEPLVRAHAAWALGRLGWAPARQALAKAARHEPEPQVSAEIAAALASLRAAAPG